MATIIDSNGTPTSESSALSVIDVTLDIRQNKMVSVLLKQYNKQGQQIKFTVTDNGEKLELKEIEHTVLFKMMTPDGRRISSYCTIDASDHTAVLTVAKNYCSYPGKGTAELEVMDALEESQVGTMNLDVVIENSAYPDEMINGSSTYQGLDEKINAVREACNSAITAKEETETIRDECDGIRNTCNDLKEEAQQYKNEAMSYANGESGTRNGEETDNAKYYYEQAVETKTTIENLLEEERVNAENIADYTAQAKESEGNTESYANNAAGSATNAANSASEAGSFASAAKTSETNASNYAAEVASDKETVKTLVNEVNNKIGSPLTASAASDMTNQNKIYVYTGSEEDYIFGNWYYYDGSTWVSGGVYNSIAFETDKDLIIEDMPADAAATRAAIDELKEDLANINKYGYIPTRYMDGYINIKGIYTSESLTTRRASEYIKVNKDCVVSVKVGYKYRIAMYSDKSENTFVKNSGDEFITSPYIFDSDYYIRISLGKDGDIDFDEDEDLISIINIGNLDSESKIAEIEDTMNHFSKMTAVSLNTLFSFDELVVISNGTMWKNIQYDISIEKGGRFSFSVNNVSGDTSYWLCAIRFLNASGENVGEVTISGSTYNAFFDLDDSIKTLKLLFFCNTETIIPSGNYVLYKDFKLYRIELNETFKVASNFTALEKRSKREILIAPSNGSYYDKDRADIVCDGVNDENDLLDAINYLEYGGTIYLLDGDFYIDSLTNGMSNNVGIEIPYNSKARTITIKGCTENKSYLSRYGASIHVTETAYNELSDSEQYSVFASVSTKMPIGDWAAYPNNLNLENFYLFLHDSSKKVVGVNGQNFGSMGLTQIGIYNENYFHDRFYHVKPATPVDGCIGVISVAEANDEMAKIHMNCVNVGGLHTGILLKRVEHLIMNTCTCSRCCYGYVFEGNMDKTLTVINCADEGNTHLPKFGNSGGHVTMIDFCIERLNADYIPDDPTGDTERQAIEVVNGQWKGFISYILQGDAYSIPTFWKDGCGIKFKTVNLKNPQW